MIGRDKSQKDYFKIIDWRDGLYYLICDGLEGNYRWIRCYDWGKVVDTFMSSSDPIGFIHDRVRAINSETSTGVKLIKCLEKLPFNPHPKKEEDNE